MIFNDYDIISLESNICTAEYVMESAKFEIANGNDSYMAVYEAATNSADRANDNWFVKIAGKIKMFAKSAIEKLKLIMNRFSTFFRKQRIIMINRKVERLSVSTSIKNNELDYTNFDGKNTKIEIFDAMEKLLSNVLHGSGKISKESSIYDYIASGKNLHDKEEVAKEFFNVREQSERKSDYVLKSDIMAVGNLTQQLLSALLKCPGTINEVSERLRKDGMVRSEIRYSVSAIYNTITSIVKILYDNAMRLIKYFLDNSKKLENDSEFSDDDSEYIFSNKFVEAVRTKNRSKMIDAIITSLYRDMHDAKTNSIRQDGTKLIALKQIEYLTKNNIDIFEPDDGDLKLDGINLENSPYNFSEMVSSYLRYNFSKYKFDWCIRVIKEASKNSNTK